MDGVLLHDQVANMPDVRPLPRTFDSLKDIEHFNRELFVQAMARNVNQIEVTYSGQEDDGIKVGVITDPPDVDINVTQLTPVESSVPGPISVMTTQRSLGDLSAQIAMSYVNAAFEDWMDNYGGEGSVTLTRDDSGLHARIQHTHYYLESCVAHMQM